MLECVDPRLQKICPLAVSDGLFIWSRSLVCAHARARGRYTGHVMNIKDQPRSLHRSALAWPGTLEKEVSHVCPTLRPFMSESFQGRRDSSRPEHARKRTGIPVLGDLTFIFDRLLTHHRTSSRLCCLDFDHPLDRPPRAGGEEQERASTGALRYQQRSGHADTTIHSKQGSVGLSP